MSYFKRTFLLTDEEKKKISEICGTVIVGTLEGRGTWQMAEEYNLQPYQLEHNIDEMLYVLRKQVGMWRYIKMLFVK